MSNGIGKIFGLWINESNVTAAEIVMGKSGPRLLNYSQAELAPNIIEGGCIVVNGEALKQAVKQLLMEAKNGPITAKNAVIALPEEKTFSHLVEIPKEKIKDEEYIIDTARDLIPIELEEAAIDYKIVRESDDQKSYVLNFVATQTSVINPLISTLKEGGINVIDADISSNALLRACSNPYNKNSGPFLIASLDFEKTSLSLISSDGMALTETIPFGGNDIIEKVKAMFSVNSADEAKNILSCPERNLLNKFDEKQVAQIRESFTDQYSKIRSKIKTLERALRNEEDGEIAAIYSMGCFSCVPGFTEVLKETFPNAVVKTELEYLNTQALESRCYTTAIGLALKPWLTAEKNDLNLLPQKNKEALKVAQISPKIKRYLTEISVLFSAMLILSGVYLVNTYLNLKISEQKVIVLNEKALNPYLTEVGKMEAQRRQQDNQIIGIVEKALPVSEAIGALDNLNTEDIALITVSFSSNETTNKNQLRVRAKASSRAETELYVATLDEIDYYDEVISPLSNLVGKGERFINVDLSLNGQKLIDAHKAAREEEKEQMLREESAPALPQAPVNPQAAPSEADNPSADPAPEAAESESAEVPTETISE